MTQFSTFKTLHPIADNHNISLADSPLILVNIDLIQSDDNQNWLECCYRFISSYKLDLELFHHENAKPNDYLWENNCIELFLADENQYYFEVNASPNGAFALYGFDDYRKPDQMPPKPTNKLAFIWQENKINVVSYPLASGNDGIIKNFISVFKYKLLLPKAFSPIKINPCVILYRDINGKKEPIYYAVNHANPPDFHDKKYWLNF